MKSSHQLSSTAAQDSHVPGSLIQMEAHSGSQAACVVLMLLLVFFSRCACVCSLSVLLCVALCLRAIV